MIFFAAATLGILTSCDPIKEEKDFDVTNISADQLLNGTTFSQYDAITDADGNITGYQEAADGNFIKFNCPNVSALTIYYIKPDDSEGILSTGKAGGMFQFVPMRGSDPNQTIHFRYVNQNGETVEATKNFTVKVAADLKPEIKLLVSDDGSKVWKWNYAGAPDGQVWGNLGDNGGGNGKSFALEGAGKWWGVTSEEEFTGQLQHTHDGKYHNDGSPEATMVFNEDGTITCYDADGNKIRSGNFEVQNYDPTYSKASRYVGILHTDAGSILWPYEINSNGNMPTDFEIAYLSPSRLVLAYPDKGAWDTGGWSEGTFWQFYSPTDVKGVLTDNEEATWTWEDAEGVACWGNGGYGGFVYGGAGSLTGGQWWGVAADGLAEQIANYNYGQADGQGATMTFTKDGLIKKSSGGSGAFTYDVKTTGDIGGYNEGKTWGRLMTTGDGILFPVRINAGTTTNEFDIVYFDDDHFVLSYPNFPAGGDNASWMEGTFWRFKKKK